MLGYDGLMEGNPDDRLATIGRIFTKAPAGRDSIVEEVGVRSAWDLFG